MRLTVSRKTAKTLVFKRKNGKKLTVRRRKKRQLTTIFEKADFLKEF